MCCREGLDKIPKAPKCAKQFIDPKATGNTVPLGASKRSRNIMNTLPYKRVGSNSNQSRIEVLDLANKVQEPGRSDHAKQGSTKLHRQYSGAARRSPQRSCMSNKRNAETPEKEEIQQHTSNTVDFDNRFKDDTPNDFEASWMDDFPSPSAVTKEFEEELCGSRQASINGGEVEAGGLHSPVSTGSQSHEKYSHVDKSQYPLSTSNDHGDQEGNLDCHGPDNEASIDIATQHFDLLCNSTQSKQMSVSTEFRTKPRYHDLFLSTGSPEKIPIPFEDPGKLAQEIKDTSMEPPSKRQRLNEHDISQQLLDNQPAQQVLPSSDDESHTNRLENLCKRLPWDDIEGIDLEFLLDYADIVEFV